MDDIIKIVASREKSGLLINGASEIVKREIKKQGGYLPAMMEPMTASLIAPMASSWIQPVASSLINAITGKEVTRTGKGQGGFLPLLAAPLLLKGIFGKGVTRAGRGYNKLDHMDKNF